MTSSPMCECSSPFFRDVAMLSAKRWNGRKEGASRVGKRRWAVMSEASISPWMMLSSRGSLACGSGPSQGSVDGPRGSRTASDIGSRSTPPQGKEPSGSYGSYPDHRVQLKGLPTEIVRCRSRTLDDHRDRIAPAEAEGHETALGAAVLHRVCEGREDAGTATSDWMTEGDGPTVHIELVVRNPEFPHHGDARGGIGLVVLEQVDVVD